MTRNITVPHSFFKYIYVIPILIILLPITLFPFIMVLWYSFHSTTTFNFLNPPFSGGDNYLNLFSSEMILAIRNTLVFVSLSVTISFILGLLLAILMSQNFRGNSVIPLLLLPPMLIAPALVGYNALTLLYELYGIISITLRQIFGLGMSPLGNASVVLFTMVAIDVWEWTPFMFLVIFAGMKALPKAPYESALIDGASPWMIFRRITLPLLMPSILVAITFRFIDAFKNFDPIFVTTMGGPGWSSTTLPILVFRTFNAGWIGLASAQSVFVLIICVLVTTLFARYIYRGIRLR